MSNPKPSRTIRWDDPAYSTKSSDETSSSGLASLSNSSIVPAGNLAVKNNIAIQTNTTASTVVSSTSWRELKTKDGRPYYYNSVTQKTVWEMPQEYREYLEFTQNGGISRRTSDFDADAQFWEILKERRVTSRWTWEEALRTIITHPNYKCIPTLQERKASFQRYCEFMRKIEEEEARLQSLAVKEAFKALLAADSKITSDTKWSEVVDRHGRAEAFLAVPSSRERVQLFEEYQSELRRTELESVWARRKEASKQIAALLKDMNLSIDLEKGKLPDWFDVKDKLIGRFPDVDPVEFLIVFEEHVQALLKEFQAARKAERQAELLKEVEKREAFCQLLKRLEKDQIITPLSTWSSIFPQHLQGSKEYCDLAEIYIYGSAPLDIFHDTLDSLQAAYHVDRLRISQYLQKEFMTTEAAKLPKLFSSYTQFKEIMREALGLDGTTSVKYAFTELYGPEAIEQDRIRINAYKHALKHLSPPIKLSESWDKARERLQSLPEYSNVPHEEDREIYFLKFKKWLSKQNQEGKEALDEEVEKMPTKKSRWDRK